MLIFQNSPSIIIIYHGNNLKIPYFTYIEFFPYTPSNYFFLTFTPIFSWSTIVVHVFPYTAFCFLHPMSFGYVSDISFFMKDNFLLTTMNCEV